MLWRSKRTVGGAILGLILLSTPLPAYRLRKNQVTDECKLAVERLSRDLQANMLGQDSKLELESPHWQSLRFFLRIEAGV